MGIRNVKDMTVPPPDFGVPNGKRFASGTATSDASNRITVSGLTFTPKMVVIEYTPDPRNGGVYDEAVDTASAVEYTSLPAVNRPTLVSYSGYVNATGFKLRCGIPSVGNVKWTAYE